MSRYKKGVKADGTPMQAKTAQPEPQKAMANYGANENRRICHKCQSAASRVTNTRNVGRMTVRYRICCECNSRRVTTEIKV
jgi:hypothetical protein